jgi:hypothetical protein
MLAHRTTVVVSADHQLTVKVPSDFPSGQAEVIVLSVDPARTLERAPFDDWLDGVLARLPPAPVVPLEALHRESLYEDD